MPAKNSTYYKDLSRAANRPLPVDVDPDDPFGNQLPFDMSM